MKTNLIMTNAMNTKKNRRSKAAGEGKSLSCNDCRNCFMHEGPGGRRHYYCMARREGLGYDAARRKACEAFLSNR